MYGYPSLMMAVSSLARIVGRSEFSKKYINYEPFPPALVA
jgi:hypothetical protein